MDCEKLTTSAPLNCAAQMSSPNNDQSGAARPKVSVIAPLYNEQECVRPLHAAIVQSLEQLGCAFEMIFVDDGSTDGTAAIAAEIASIDPRLCIVRFRRNYGQTPAMAAGIEYARGEIIVTMDGDLQNDPEDIGRLLEQLDEGYDIVVGWRFNRQDKLLSRKIPSRIANWLIARMTGVPIKDNGCSLKAYRASLIKQIPLYSEMHRFIPAMASIAGPRIAEIKVRHHARQFGQSKYGLSRTYKVLLDLLVVKTVASFTSRPLIWFSLLATPLAVRRRRSPCPLVLGLGDESGTVAASGGRRRHHPVVFGVHALLQRRRGRARLQAWRCTRSGILAPDSASLGRDRRNLRVA